MYGSSRAFAAMGLVHGQDLVAVGRRGAREERVVRRVRQQAEQLEGTALDRRRHRQGRQSRFEWPFIAGHAWPSASIGFPQN